jgi:hypothetical protein
MSMSKLQNPIPFRPDYTGAASVRALGLAIAIARARERHGRESKFERELRRAEATLRRMRRTEEFAQTEARRRRIAWETALARAEAALKRAKGK